MSSNLPTFIRFNGNYLDRLSLNFVDETDYIGYTYANTVPVPVMFSQNSVWTGPSPWGLFVANSTANVIIQIPTAGMMAANYVLYANGSWAPGGNGGAGAVPGGLNTQVQFNDSTVFAGSAGFTFNKTSNTLSVGTATINSTFFSQTANNTLFVGSVSAANVVSNAQLIANLSNYLTAVPAAYVQNTDSRTLSGNLTFTGANAYFTVGLFAGANVAINTTSIFIGNTTANTTQNSSGFYVNGSLVGTGGAVVLYSSQSLTANQAAQARANIGVTKKNLILNGGMGISQQNGNTVSSASGYYPVDNFFTSYTTTGTMTAAQVASPTPGGSPNRIRMTVTTADASVAASDLVVLETKLEGSRISDLRLGQSNAKTFVLQFGVNAPAGTYCVSFRNGPANRNLVCEYTISGGEANTDVVKSVVVNGDTSGTWLTDTGLGLIIDFILMAGTNFQVTPNVWGANGLGVATSSQFNMMGTVGNKFELFDVGLYEGSVAPPFELPDPTLELFLCQRYWQKSYDYGTAVGTSTLAGMSSVYINGPAGLNAGGVTQNYVAMRATPTIAGYSTTGAANKARDLANGTDVTLSVDSIGQKGFRWYASTASSPTVALGMHWTADSRL